MSGGRRQRLVGSAKQGAVDGAVDALSSKDTRQNAMKAGIGGAKEGYQNEGTARGAAKGAGQAAAQSVAHDVAISAAKGAVKEVSKEAACIIVEDAVQNKRDQRKRSLKKSNNPDQGFFSQSTTTPAPVKPNAKVDPLKLLEELHASPHKLTYLKSNRWVLGPLLVQAKNWTYVNEYIDILKDLELEDHVDPIVARSEHLNHAGFLRTIAQSTDVDASVILNLLTNFNPPHYFISQIAKIEGLKKAVRECINNKPTEKWALLEKCIRPNHSLGQFFMVERNPFSFLNPWHKTTQNIIDINEQLDINNNRSSFSY